MSHFFSSQNVMTQNQLVLSFYRFHSLLLVLSLLNSKMSQFFHDVFDSFSFQDTKKEKRL